MKNRPILRTLFALLSSMLASAASAASLPVGAPAPAISATTDAGDTLDLGKLYPKHAYTLVWFYPMALTGGCTKQGCSLRDASADFAKHDVAIVGVSTDSVDKQKEFKEHNNFPFPLLADTDSKVRHAFGQEGGARAKREAYLIDRNGKIVYHDEGATDQQADNVLKFLAKQKS